MKVYMVTVKKNEKLPPEAFTPPDKKVRVERVGVIQISTTVDKQRHAYVLSKQSAGEIGWGWADLIDAGIYAKSKPDILQERLTALENEVKARKKVMQRLLPVM